MESKSGTEPCVATGCSSYPPRWHAGVVLLEGRPVAGGYYDQRLGSRAVGSGFELRKLLAADINVVLAIANDSHLIADLPWIAESISCVISTPTR